MLVIPLKRALSGAVCGALWLAELNAMFGSHHQFSEAQVAKIPPKTRTAIVKENIHGVEIADAYRWLENAESQETSDWIESQNEHTDAMIASLPGRGELKRRLTELMRIDWLSEPTMRNGRYFFMKRLRDQELSVIYMRKGLQAKDEVLIDPHPMSPDHTTSVSIRDVSEDGTILAYAVQEGGQDEVTIRFFDTDRHEHLPDCLPKARYWDISLKPDNTGFYYVRYCPDGARVYYHPMAAPPESGAADVEVFGQGCGPDKIIFANLSDDGRHLLITVWHGSAARKSEVYYQDVAKKGPVLAIVNDIDARFIGQVAEDHLFLQTNWEAPNGRIFRVDLNNPKREHWRQIVPETDAVIEGFSLAGGNLFVNYLHNVSSRVKIFEPDGCHLRDLPLPALGTVRGPFGRWKNNETFFTFSSFQTPPTTRVYDVAKESVEVWWRSEVPVNSEIFDVNQAWYESKDGTRIPMFLVHRKGIRLDGSNPTLLTGYGGFNVSLTPWFSASAALWVEAGGLYAVANLRGGGEFGEDWHNAGMLEKKQNVFDDFIAAAEWLIEKGYTRPEMLAISGGSNGGLLVAAALTQRPELFQVVVCTHPLLDMIRYHKFLVAKFWVSELGSAEDPDQFKYLYAYSPYHKVKQGAKYPAVLFITGDSDTRVDPLHARKMTALLQSATASHKPILLRYHTRAGHSGGRSLSRLIEDTTDEFSFLFWQLGVSFPPPSSPDSSPPSGF